MRTINHVLIAIEGKDIDGWGNVTIPDDVKSIRLCAFDFCMNLTSINVSENNKNYKSIDGNLYSKDGKTLIRYAIGKTVTEFTIPDNVTSIGYGAFEDCNNLTSIIIPNSVTIIKGCAFYNCSNLSNITIPDSVTSIGEYAFYNCSTLILPLGVEKIKAVKGFYLRNGKLECRGFNFEVGKKYKEDSVSLCARGFHACANGGDVFKYYSGPRAVYYEVELSGISPDRGDDSKICGTTIKLLRKLTVAEAANYRSVIKESRRVGKLKR